MTMKSLLKRTVETRTENVKLRSKKLNKCRMNMVVQRMMMTLLKVNKALALMMMNQVRRTRMVQMRT